MPAAAPDPRPDERPAVWVGHVVLKARDLARATDYWEKVGMRLLVSGREVSVLELRGGTHLVLLPSDEPLAEGAPAPFDVMVEDLDAAWKRYGELDFAPSEIERGKIHDSFTMRDPTGYLVTVNSSHVSDKPV